MPKLSAKQASAVEEADEVQLGFEAWPDGRYKATLDSVEERESQAGNMMWNAVFRDFINVDGEKMRGRQWLRLMLPQTKMPKDYLPVKMRDKGLTVAELSDKEKEERAEAWKNYQNMVAARIKEFFAAFGYASGSDTEEVEGMECGVNIGHETQQMGRNAGKVVNVINGLFPVEDLGWDDDEDTEY